MTDNPRAAQSEADPAAMAAWRQAHQRCVERVTRIRLGLNTHTFATSELDAIAEALAPIEAAAWPMEATDEH